MALRAFRLKLTMRPRVAPVAHSGRPVMGAPTIRAWPRAKKIACMRFFRTADCEPRAGGTHFDERRTTYDERFARPGLRTAAPLGAIPTTN